MCATDVSDSVTGRIVSDRVTFGGRTIEKQAFCESDSDFFLCGQRIVAPLAGIA